MEIPWLLFLWTMLFGAVLSYDDGQPVPNPPRHVTVRQESDGVLISWLPPANTSSASSADYYIILYRSSGQWIPLSDKVFGKTSFLWTGASPDVLYYFKVYSYGKNDKPSEASNVATLSIETEAEEPESEPEYETTVTPEDEVTTAAAGHWVGSKPGFQVKVTQHGLSYAAQIAIDTLMLKLMDLEIPDMEETIGPATVGISGVRVMEFPRPRSALRVIPQQGLRWRARGLSPVIHANYAAKIALGFWDVTKEGKMIVQGKNMQFALDFFIGRDIEGRPTVTVYDCTARGDVNLSFEGGWSDALNLGSRIFKRKIKSIILNQVCSNAKAEINEKTGWALSKFNLVEKIPPDFEIDFSLVRFPAFRPGSVQSFHKGAFYYSPNRQEPPFEPAEIPHIQKHRKKMMYVYITSYMLNTAFYALYANNKLAINVTSRQVPPNARKYFATSCPEEFCLGTVLPEIAQYYPTSELALSVFATDYPRVNVDSGSLRLTGSMGADIYAMVKRKPERILSVLMNVTGAVKVVVKNETVMFNVTGLRSKAEIQYSKMGTSNSEVFDNMVNMASKEFLLPVLKDVGDTGFTLPELENVRLITPEVINVDGLKDVMIIASDFEILPPE